ncbi:MAG: 50S ribosomal protein L30 [Proteobacteria bacterium]|nr:50S ribosomal protein L30 [Pseudomonadota bacterium]
MVKKKTKVGQVKVTQIKSTNKSLANHKACVRGLGIRKMHQSRIVDATPENMGMINKAIHLLKVEEVK